MAGQPRALPTGLVTFVFSDIEGSTRLFRRVGERYPPLMDRHRALLHQAWDAHAGRQVEAVGDSVLAAFSDADEAIRACGTAQRLIGAESWPPDARVRVRMGVHTGLASPRNSGYVAIAVHQAARIAAAAHGGQVLVSAEAVDRAHHPGLEMRDLGRFRLRDFGDPVRLFQPVGRGLAETFPAVRALPAESHNLVRPPTRLCGRAEEIDAVSAAVVTSRLVTVAGPGGVGKTRLVVELGLAVVDDWPDGVWFVDLSALDEPALLSAAIADASGVPAGSGDRWTDVLDHFGHRRSLLVLDNCEHHVDEVSALARSLLVRCPGVSVLATSREPLGLAEEAVWRLDPLAVPVAGDVEEVTASPAAELFVARAQAVNPAFRIDALNAAAIAGVCRRLDGLPLAIEVAAARAAALNPQEILDGLADRFRLRNRDRGVPERQRTLFGLLEWSERLLPDPERVALRRLGVFGGGFSLSAATAALEAAPLSAQDVPELVWSLVDKSLVVADLTANSTRYRLLETVRAYARRRLDERGETAATADRLATWFLDRLGPDHAADRTWIGAVDADLDNLRALVPLTAGPASTDVGDEVAQRLACTIGRFRSLTQRFSTGIKELGPWTRDLAAATPSRVALLTTLADLHRWRGDTAAAGRLLEEAEALAAEVGVPAWDDVCVVKTAGELAIRSGRPAEAIRIVEKALAGPLSPRGRVRTYNLAVIARAASGDLPAAEDAARAEVDACRALGDEPFLAGAYGNLAELEFRSGRVATAAGHQLACLDLAVVLGQPAMVAFTLIVAGRLATPNDAEAVFLHAKAEAVLDEIGLALYDDDARASEDLLVTARDRLGPAEFDRSWRAGRNADLVEMIEVASRVLRVTAGTAGSAVDNGTRSPGEPGRRASDDHSGSTDDGRTGRQRDGAR